MSFIKILSILLVIAGAAFIFASLAPARRTSSVVSAQMRQKWLALIYLMYFFFAGYLFFDAVLLMDLTFPVELVTGGVFFGGAIFVYIVINLSRTTIGKIRETEQDLRLLNETLEQRVVERTAELRKERDKAQKYLDIAGVILVVIDAAQRVVRINAKGCEILGHREEEIVGKNWFDHFIPENIQNEVKSTFARLMAGEALPVEYFENSVVTKYGEERLIAWHNSVLRDGADTIIGTLSSGEDITERKQAEDSLKASEERYTKLFHHSNDGIVLHDLDGNILDVNYKATDMLGYTKPEMLKINIAALHPEEAIPTSRNAFEVLAQKGFVKFEVNFKNKNGAVFPAEVSSSLFDVAGKTVIQGIVRDITDRKKAEEQIQTLAYYDGLTNLPNRTFYNELVARALVYAKRGKKTMATLFIDLDEFKRINDTLGHSAGDRLLQEIAARLLQCVRKSDTVARSEDGVIMNTVSRLGGDEFIVLLHDIAQPQDASLVARRMLTELSRPIVLNDQEVTITASIGISLYPGDAEDTENLLRYADIAMYHAKDQGKNNYQFYSQSLHKTSLERFTLENELRKALEREEFLLHYQPKLEARTRTIIGMEALIRWQHPEKGLIPPAEFIPLAEETGLIAPIGEWLLRAACAQIKAIHGEGFQSLTIGVNLSNRQFAQQDLVEMVGRVLNESAVDPKALEVEITESTIMQNPAIAIITLEHWKDMGIQIAIDDFGKGYSSLDYLKRLPLNSLKIDRAFIMNITTNPDDAAITTAIVSLAHSLKLKVVAEGVETEEQLAFLQELGCDEVQGYLFSRPVPAEELVEVLRSAEKG
ncbi:MAG TPA: hypothetical protein DCO77_06775 [Nitrospiraceae bacterium]|nr:hypothetical protein [Nitrospiraceae bacterium]